MVVRALLHPGGVGLDLIPTCIHHLATGFVECFVLLERLLHAIGIAAFDGILSGVSLPVTVSEKTGTVSHFVFVLN